MSFLRIAHLSDPHFGTILPGVAEGLFATLAELRPQLFLLTGDITQRARRAQFEAARDFRDSLHPTPFLGVPGNHDIPLFNIFARLFHPYRGYQSLFAQHLEKDHLHGDVLVTGLNSTSRWRHVQGEFDIPRLETRLKMQKPAAKVHIAAFHHPMDCAKTTDEENLLKKREETMRVFETNRIDLVLGGHIHDPFVTLSKRRYPEIKRSMVLVVAGTCLSWRTRPGAPNSFQLIDVDTKGAPRLKITRYDQRENLRFTEESARVFVREGDLGWAEATPGTV